MMMPPGSDGSTTPHRPPTRASVPSSAPPSAGSRQSARDRTRILKGKVAAHFGGASGAGVGMVNEYLLLREVPVDDLTSGHTRCRRVDLVAVGIWKRTGHLVHGIETKVSRADWLAELRDPAKAQAGASRCHAWWVAVDDASIVRDGERPDGWGLLVPSGRGLRRKVRATVAERDLDPRWVASIAAAAATQHSACRGLVRMEERTRFTQERHRLAADLGEARWKLQAAERVIATATGTPALSSLATASRDSGEAR